MSAIITILAGGQGTRFWPKSRLKMPKQFLSISNDGESLIQATARRVSELASPDGLWIITNDLHRDMMRQQVPSARLICEPTGRNTAASIGLAAIYAARAGGDPVMVVLPADHAVKDEEKLRECLERAIELAGRERSLVTIGIPPQYPHTGYGYIKRGARLNERAYVVSRFYEKPNYERAKDYCESGNFYWNSGMFAWRASVILEAFKEDLPAMHASLEEIGAAIGTPSEAETLARVFPQLESISIDFGILEHSRDCLVVEALDFGWNDVGSWDAWADHFHHDQEGNLLKGDVLAIDSQNCIVYSENRLLAVLGAQDLVVIDSGDAVLICPRHRVQDVKQIVDQLKKNNRTELI